MTIRIYYMHYT